MLQRGGQLLADQRQLQRPLDTRRQRLFAQRGAGLAEQQQGVAGFALIEQFIDQVLQGIGPVTQATLALQQLGQCGQALNKGHQPSEQLRAGTFQRIQRPTVAQQRRLPAGQLWRRGKTQQQAVEALPPSEGGISRQAQLRTVLAIAAPTHAGRTQPVTQQW